jgi:hypothetical protein
MQILAKQLQTLGVLSSLKATGTTNLGQLEKTAPEDLICKSIQALENPPSYLYSFRPSRREHGDVGERAATRRTTEG